MHDGDDGNGLRYGLIFEKAPGRLENRSNIAKMMLQCGRSILQETAFNQLVLTT